MGAVPPCSPTWHCGPQDGPRLLLWREGGESSALSRKERLKRAVTLHLGARWVRGLGSLQPWKALCGSCCLWAVSFWQGDGLGRERLGGTDLCSLVPAVAKPPLRTLARERGGGRRFESLVRRAQLFA